MKRLMLALVFGLPLLMAVLWIASGFETLTKSHKPVEVAVRSDLFNDIVSETQLQRGPIAGYYVGLDAVGVTVVTAALIGWVSHRLSRRRRLKKTM
ncbi:MAG TPA: hypothetical protein VMV81_11380 [Phycisphaerae bacterium]|nr:hypothetical protein [Phycisphaerae bacterium]